MADYLFTWSPKGGWPLTELQNLIRQFESGEDPEIWWRCGNQAAQSRDRAYFLKQGEGPRGLFGVGTISSAPEKRVEPSDSNEAKWRAPIHFDLLVDPTETLLIDFDRLMQFGPRRQWVNSRSGIELGSDAARAIDVELGSLLGTVNVPLGSVLSLPSEEKTTVSEVARYRLDNRLERNPRAARLAKRIHGLRCQACHVDFAERYGELGKGFIEVHHLRPLSDLDLGETVTLSIESDLAVLCANCHRMIHRQQDPSDLDALKAALR